MAIQNTGGPGDTGLKSGYPRNDQPKWGSDPIIPANGVFQRPNLPDTNSKRLDRKSKQTMLDMGYVWNNDNKAWDKPQLSNRTMTNPNANTTLVDKNNGGFIFGDIMHGSPGSQAWFPPSTTETNFGGGGSYYPPYGSYSGGGGGGGGGGSDWAKDWLASWRFGKG